MTKYHNPAKVVTDVCRFSYANLWEAKAMDENSKPKYSVSLIIPKSDTKTIEKIRARHSGCLRGGSGKVERQQQICSAADIPQGPASGRRLGTTGR